MFWKTLKIEPTTDKTKIRDAYREVLAVTNPEDKPEEFKKLREAYEQAMAYADANKDDTQKTPLEIWNDELFRLYDSFPERLDVRNWQKLLNEKICLSIDTRTQCEELLLKFFMDRYLIPHEVWVYLDQQFSFKERQNELYDTYPHDFVDYVIMNGINFDDNLPLKLFKPGKDGDACQRYVSLYYQMTGKSDKEEALEIGKELMSLPEQHPYGSARYLSIRLNRGETDALDELISLQRQYPEDLFIGNILLYHLSEAGDYERCFVLIEELKKADEKNIDLRYYEACCLANTGRKQEAVKVLNRLMRDTVGNVQLQYELDEKRKEWNKDIMVDLQQKLEEEPDDVKAVADLTWTYLENDMLAEAKETLARLPEDYEDRFDYYNLHASMALAMEKYREAIGYLKQLVEVAENLPEDTEENRIRHSRVGETLTRLGYCYFITNDMEKANEAYDKALQHPQSRIEALNHLAQISLNSRNYEKTIDYARKLIDEYPEGYRGYLFLAFGLFKQYNDREAYNAVEHALDLCRTDVTVYALKARILMRNEATDGAKEIIDFLVENGLADDPLVLFCQGVLKEDGENDHDEAIGFYERSRKQLDGHEHQCEYGAELLYRLLCLKGEKLDGNRQEDREVMMELAEKGLVCNPDHYGLLDYKGWLLNKAKDYDKALEVYQKLLGYPNHSPAIEAQIGNIYYHDLEHKADQALEYYLKSLEKGGNVSGHFYAGMCNLYMMRFDEAEKHFLQLKEKEEDSIDGPYRLSFLYAMKGELDKALAQAEDTIRVTKDIEGNQAKYYVRKATILRRMKRYEEAVQTIQEAMDRYDYPQGYRTVFQIYAQSSRLDKAEQHLKKWQESGPDNDDLADCLILLEMYRNDFKKAQELKKKTKNLNRDRDLEVDQIISEYFGEYEKQRKEIQKWLDYRISENSYDLSRVQGTLSQCCFRLGDMENARYYALEALKDVDEKLGCFETNKLLFMARKIRILAMLGKREEAEKLMEECKKMPFCETCPEHRCKDVDIFTMEAYEIFGDYRKAYEIARRCRELYPDEEDFMIAERNLAEKVK
ncbi:MAG: tetratricopeptide repeat protein [Erysipelotrichaceae bacterium]|nr:tetratricopeptide repeat protein [Erysipelotrichaceae bacterium]